MLAYIGTTRRSDGPMAEDMGSFKYKGTAPFVRYMEHGVLKAAEMQVADIFLYVFEKNEIYTLAIYFGAGMKHIPEYLCRRMSTLKTVSLPEKLETIGMKAFEGCTFRNIALPETLRAVGSKALNSTALTTATYRGRRWEIRASRDHDVTSQLCAWMGGKVLANYLAQLVIGDEDDEYRMPPYKKPYAREALELLQHSRSVLQ